MKVLIAGGTGAIGQELVAQLAGQGHYITVLARSQRRVGTAAGLGAVVIRADALVREEVTRAVAIAEPDAVVNLLTALPARIDPRHIDRDLAATNRLRTEGARNLLDAADAAGVRRHVVESLAFIADPGGPPVTDESAPIWQAPPKKFAAAVAAVAELERLALQHDATVLRFGHLYGPGTAFALDGAFVDDVRAGKVPLVGKAGSIFSFIHVADAASAIVAALAAATPGVFNLVDDQPTAMHDWLPELAGMVGARPPKQVPAWLARMAVGAYGVAYMTTLRGSSNGKIKAALGWEPAHSGWREGFEAVIGVAGR